MFLDLSDTHRNAVRVQSIKGLSSPLYIYINFSYYWGCIAVERCISEIHGQLLVLKNTDENLTWSHFLVTQKTSLLNPFYRHARLAESARKLLSDEEITVRRVSRVRH
jgi:hypothetical protein